MLGAFQEAFEIIQSYVGGVTRMLMVSLYKYLPEQILFAECQNVQLRPGVPIKFHLPLK
jgi:hypothetical protein